MKPTLIIVGLGNPGSAYERTRHNAGFRGLDALHSACAGGEWKEKAKVLSRVSEIMIGEVSVLLAKPLTFMNRSGEAVQKLVHFYKADPSFQLLVISDDCDLPLGEIRFRNTGGPGTHNGLKSVVEHVGEGFPRIRIGLGSAPAGTDLAQWVLSVPPAAERERLEQALHGELPRTVEEFVLGSAR
ncbi:MAG: aminoacyl-tRNA hydrolase [Candidatus Peribacteraceae bacterium]|nr:aminoacyl-tRNA hydrolase [Candidatus Peribacteraceae bacterium]MDD5742703.1 aminoacyl-tRNA hydrolase [Candidatus Peribacteraceae bacterium]